MKAQGALFSIGSGGPVQAFAERRVVTTWDPPALMAGFVFSFRACSVLIASRVFLADPHVGLIANGVLECLLLGLAAFGGFGPCSQDSRPSRRDNTLRWVLLYLAFSGVSLAWSSAVSLSSSALYWSLTASDVLVVLLMLCRKSAEQIAGSAMAGFIYGTVLLASIAWCMPAQSDLRLGDKDFFNTNQLANLCAFAIFFAQFLVRRRMGHWIVPSFFLFVTLLRSLSKTTIAAFLVAEAILLWRDRALSRRMKLGLVSIAVLLGLAFAGLFSAYFDVYSNAGNQAETLTGRVGIWAYAYSEAIQKPWFGHGFDSMWKVFPPFGPDQFEPRHAENELLQQFFAYGFSGVILLCAIYWSLFKGTRAMPNNHYGTMILRTTLIYVLIRGLAEAEPFDLLMPLWLVVLIAAVLSAQGPGRAVTPALASFGTSSLVPGRRMA